MYLGFGSNNGDSYEIFRNAIYDIAEYIFAIRVSALYSSKPLYVTNQPDFLNFVLSGITALLPHELLALTQSIEIKYGRNRAVEIKKGPRPLDIDILLYGNEQIVSTELTVPHPGIKERAFVLLPLLDLEPELQLPGENVLLAEYLKNCEGQGIYQISPSII